MLLGLFLAVTVAADSGARMVKIGDNVYAIIHQNATEEWPHGNTGVIVGDDGVLVVDATYLPSRAKADIALIRSVTDKPVRYVVYTHWHFDHNNGGIAYRDAFPGVMFVSERETAHWIDLNGTWWSRMQTADSSAHRQALAKLEAELSTGHARSAADRHKLEANIRQRRNELDELASLRVVTPTLLFDRELTLTLGRRRVEIHNWGRANSPDDVTIYLPDDKILYTGDILVQDPLPYVGGSWPVTWVGVLRQIEAIPVATLVPGHGPVMHDQTYTRHVRGFLEAATVRVEAMMRQGKTLDQIKSGLNLDEFRRGFPLETDPDSVEDWRVTLATLAERSYDGVRGGR